MTTATAQVVLLPPGLRFYSVICRSCLRAASGRGGLAPVVKGELPEEITSLTVCCPCGHPITLVAREAELPGRDEASDREGTINYSTERRGRGP
jgi:hypothetical protein